MKLRTKILIPIVLIIFFLGISISYINRVLMGDSVESQFNNRGISITTGLAMNGSLGVLMHDTDHLEQIMDAAMIDPEVQYIIFYDNESNRIAERGDVPHVPTIDLRDIGSEVISESFQRSSGIHLKEFGTAIYARGRQGDPIGAIIIGITTDNVLSDKNNAFLWSFLLSVIFSAIAIAIVLFVTKVIRLLSDVIKKIDNADLNTAFNSEQNDEIGELLRAFDRFILSIRDTLLEVSGTTSSVVNASAEISSSTEQIAAGAQEQSSQANEVVSAVEEMTKTIVENSKNAFETAEMTKQSKETAEQGYKVVEETLGGMRRIAGVVKRSAQSVRELGRSSDQIGEIIGVIDDIADQTNLLALNAAIEAARAGEQGRGFAVVADEVRKLAERTTRATKEIAVMIKKIQDDTGGAVQSMDEGTREVDEGIRLADNAGEALQKIMSTSQMVTDMVAQIAAASEQQSSGSEQISKNVEAIGSVTQQTASGTEHIARAAEDLNRLTEDLQELVNRFKLSAAGAERTTRSSDVESGSANYRRSEKRSGSLVRENGYVVGLKNTQRSSDGV